MSTNSSLRGTEIKADLRPLLSEEMIAASEGGQQRAPLQLGSFQLLLRERALCMSGFDARLNQRLLVALRCLLQLRHLRLLPSISLLRSRELHIVFECQGAQLDMTTMTSWPPRRAVWNYVNSDSFGKQDRAVPNGGAAEATCFRVAAKAEE